jgi:hypothetical protein
MKAPEVGVMHHYTGLFYAMAKKRQEKFVPPFVADEYHLLVTTILGPTMHAVEMRDWTSNRSFWFNKVKNESNQIS